MPLELALSEKNKPCLVLDGHLYVHERTNEGTGKKIWSCVQKLGMKCKGRVHTIGNDVVTQTLPEHNHAPDPAKVDSVRRYTAMKQQASSSMETSRNIIQKGTENVSQGVAAALPSSDAISRTIRRIRQRESGAPAAPVNLTDLEIPEEYQKTLDGAEFLAFDSGPGPDRILIFCSSDGKQLLANHKNWFCDGTFKISPNLFYQVFTIHALVEGTVVPCAYALLPNKTQETYTRVFEVLHGWPEGLNPETVMTDFELAAKNGIRTNFPNVQFKRCFFHLSQSCWRKLQGLGHQERYCQDEQLAVTARSLPGLAFVPPADVRRVFMEVGRGFPLELEDFLIYFEKTYVGGTVAGQPRPPLHPIEEWNQYDSVINKLPRSNNPVEAWHKSFQDAVGADHPTIWKLIDALKREESLQRFRVLQLLVGVEPPRKRRKYQNLDARILNRVLKYQQIQDKGEYVRSMAHNVKF